MPSSSSRNIEHITDIHAPIEKVWEALIDIGNWKWNRWTRLHADRAEEGVKGKLLASFEGNDEWESFSFTFGTVEENSMTWTGSVGPSGCLFNGHHTMKLEEIEGDTRLIHTEKFSGILPRLGLGLPYDKLDRNYLLMNEALKKFVENGVM